MNLTKEQKNSIIATTEKWAQRVVQKGFHVKFGRKIPIDYKLTDDPKKVIFILENGRFKYEEVLVEYFPQGRPVGIKRCQRPGCKENGTKINRIWLCDAHRN